jgi:hypothetical protein
MAIVFESQRKPVNWVKMLFVVTVVAFVVFAVYYLFFAPSPKIDVVLPASLEHAAELANPSFSIDPSAVIQSAAFKALKSYVGSPSTGALGRPNPFAPF